MNWTTTPPTEPGYYWHRLDEHTPALLVQATGNGAYYCCGSIYPHNALVAGEQWFGPLTAPPADHAAAGGEDHA